MAKDLTVMLEDRVGAFADLGEALGKAGINIEGMCGIAHEGTGIMHVLVEDSAGARKALEGVGIKVEGETDVLVIDLSGRDKPGTAGALARKAANAGVNITFAYTAMGDRAVIAADNLEKARAAIS